MHLPRIGNSDEDHHEELQEKITAFLEGLPSNKRTPEQQLHLIENWLIENLDKVPMEEQRRILWSVADMNCITDINCVGRG